ncbi:MAG: preprotein translocase subunit YajC [Brevundimonas sp.]|uniref:preprotein translocase subunit YajC n=1 Tax=Brevundimonas sp. TaxID=1871086 RepID=UPI0027211CC8|nr:preprotein translocase subunit YajC [Brevundimonas sp.]MDO9586608.1 preprotein translocase subunit YajC [Brevundimonas sp.]MDP3655972.1 preprotein translocase subunit YajC [Brevundimonas sp.]MDZ4114231.1 preprotein translocase subunit YajC [Brevundimonas sp.]
MAGPFGTLIFFVPVIILFYFMLIRPQQKAMKAHQALVAGLKRSDTVVLSNGMIGKVTRVENDEAMVEIAQGVNVRVVKQMITQVRDRAGVAANDTKSIAKS